MDSQSTADQPEECAVRKAGLPPLSPKALELIAMGNAPAIKMSMAALKGSNHLRPFQGRKHVGFDPVGVAHGY